GGAGLLVNRSVENAMREQRATDLNALVDASVTSMRVWIGEQKINVEHLADDEILPPLVAELLPMADDAPTAERRLVQAKAQDTIRARLLPKARRTGYVGYHIVSPKGVILAADQDAPVGKSLTGFRKDIFDQAIAGKTLVSK